MSNEYTTFVIYKDKDMNAKITLKQPVVESMDETGTLDIDELPTSFVSVDIPVWADRAIGDTVVCYFGLHRQTKIVRDLTSLMFFEYANDLIESGQYKVYYTITDTAGNTNTSEILNVTVVNSGGGQSPENIYPQPVFGQAENGVIDLGGLTTDIFVTCYPPNSPSVAGDTLRVHFGEITAENTLSYPLGFTALVTIPKDEIHHGNYSVFYEVLQNGTRIGYSPSVEIQCETDVNVYPPVFPQAVDNVIDLDGEFSHIEMDIPHFDAAEYGITIKCTIGEVETSIVIENSSDLTFKALFDKMLFNEGQYIAKYTVVLNDDYRVYSEQCSISFSHGGTVEPPSDDDIWDKIVAGDNFYLSCSYVGNYLMAHDKGHGDIYLSTSATTWHPKVISRSDRTFILTCVMSDEYQYSITQLDDGFFSCSMGTSQAAVFKIEASESTTHCRRLSTPSGLFLTAKPSGVYWYLASMSYGINKRDLYDFYFSFLK